MFYHYTQLSTSWPLSPLLISLHLQYLSIPPSLPLSLISFLTLFPSLPLFLPASCCLGPPGSYSFPSDKRMDRTTKKKKKENEWQLWTPLFLAPLCLPPLPCSSLLLTLSHPLSLFSVLSLRESSWSLVSQSCLTVTQTILSTQPELQWAAFYHRAKHRASWSSVLSVIATTGLN